MTYNWYLTFQFNEVEWMRVSGHMLSVWTFSIFGLDFEMFWRCGIFRLSFYLIIFYFSCPSCQYKVVIEGDLKKFDCLQCNKVRHSSLPSLIRPCPPKIIPLIRPLPPKTIPLIRPLPPKTIPLIRSLPPKTIPLIRPLPPKTTPLIRPLPPKTIPLIRPLPPKTIPLIRPHSDAMRKYN